MACRTSFAGWISLGLIYAVMVSPSLAVEDDAGRSIRFPIQILSFDNLSSYQLLILTGTDSVRSSDNCESTEHLKKNDRVGSNPRDDQEFISAYEMALLTNDEFWFCVEKLAKEGYVISSYYLGRSYANGIKRDKDLKEAEKWFRSSAMSDFILAQADLGTIYMEGLGVDKDFREAARWYGLAAEKGDVQSQHNLGSLFAMGLGVKKDPEKAVGWFRRAAERGLPEARYSLGYAYLVGFGVPKDEVKAFDNIQSAAKLGLPIAQNDLANMYVQGIGTPRDFGMAETYYRFAIQNGFTKATRNLDALVQLREQGGENSACEFGLKADCIP